MRNPNMLFKAADFLLLIIKYLELALGGFYIYFGASGSNGDNAKRWFSVCMTVTLSRFPSWIYRYFFCGGCASNKDLVFCD